MLTPFGISPLKAVSGAVSGVYEHSICTQGKNIQSPKIG
jgi:hypothetical protein